MAITYKDRIKCADCRYARAVKNWKSKKWVAVECGNCESEFYKALLNVTSDGYKQADITWRGCEQGKPVERLVSA
jgi:hypothetical protein